MTTHPYLSLLLIKATRVCATHPSLLAFAHSPADIRYGVTAFATHQVRLTGSTHHSPLTESIFALAPITTRHSLLLQPEPAHRQNLAAPWLSPTPGLRAA